MALVTIRRMEKGDLAEMTALLADGDVMEHLEAPFTFDRAKSFLEEAGLCEPPRILAALCGGVFIGYVIFHDYGKDDMELGWVLKKSEWGKGYAQELTRLMTSLAFARGKNAVIECVPEQRVSRHIALKNGFRYIGTEDGCDVYRKLCGEQE